MEMNNHYLCEGVSADRLQSTNESPDRKAYNFRATKSVDRHV